MAASEKVKAVLAISGKKQNELAAYFEMTAQSMSNKMVRDSWSAKDLTKVAEFCNCEFGFIFPNGQHIIIEKDTPNH